MKFFVIFFDGFRAYCDCDIVAIVANCVFGQAFESVVFENSGPEVDKQVS